ncbi:hypothetical protein C0991_001852, partial [Blastosporella zonata]
MSEESALTGPPDPSQSSCTVDLLSFELLTVIIESLCPILVRRVETLDEWGDPIKAQEADEYNRREFDRDLEAFATLRFVCSSWSSVVTPLLFREAVLFTTPFSSPDKVDAFFTKVRAEHLRSLIIFGSRSTPPPPKRPMTFGGGYPHSWFIPRRRDPPPPPLKCPSNRAIAEAVGRGIGLCTRLEKLELRGDYPAFINRQWLPKFAPRLASTVTSLIIEGKTREIDIPYALLGLGRSLVSLEIIGWCSQIPPTSFHLPSMFPKLRHVALRDSHPSRENVTRFFSRLTAGKADNHFRSLDLTDVQYTKRSNAQALEILAINNLGAHLTELVFTADDQDPTSSINVLRLCPNLEQLSFGFRAPHKDILNYLPKRLHSLELSAINHEEWDVEPKDVIHFLASGQFPLLRRMKLFVEDDLEE